MRRWAITRSTSGGRYGRSRAMQAHDSSSSVISASAPRRLIDIAQRASEQRASYVIAGGERHRSAYCRGVCEASDAQNLEHRAEGARGATAAQPHDLPRLLACDHRGAAVLTAS